jgi:hypothetical protein
MMYQILVHLLKPSTYALTVVYAMKVLKKTKIRPRHSRRKKKRDAV